MKSSNGLYILDDNYVDTEWEEAMSKDEKACYYKVYEYNGGIQIKCYKPSIAALLSKRTGKRMEKIG